MLDGSRLQSLLKLLDSKNSSVRRLAVKNLASLVGNQLEDFGNLLCCLLDFLQKPLWDTRFAAAECVSAVLVVICDSGVLSDKDVNISWTPLGTFSLERVLATSQLRLADDESRYYSCASGVKGTSDQRGRIDRQLGLHPHLGVDSRNWYTDEDLANADSTAANQEAGAAGTSGMGGPDLVVMLRKDSADASATLLHFIRIVLLDLRNVTWEKRHGAALALKAIVLRLGHLLSSSSVDVICSELLIALSLDRFNDFVEARAVAPVREACAQILGLICQRLSTDAFRLFAANLAQFLQPNVPWQCKQSALLTLKYLLPSTSPERRSDILSGFKAEIRSSLEDANDEVAEATSQALLPVADVVGRDWDPAILLQSTWKLLARCGHTAETSVSGLLELIRFWMSADEGFLADEDQLVLLLKLMDHSGYRIRNLAFQCLLCVTEERRGGISKWSDVSVQMIFRVLFRRVLLEPM